MKRQTMPFKKMEYINAFLEACNKYGVSASETFQTVDLYESQNIGAVITCISALGRKVCLILLLFGNLRRINSIPVI